MQTGWVINRRFNALSLDHGGRRWVLESADDAAHGSHVEIVFEKADQAALEGEVEVAEIQRQSLGSSAGRYVIHGSRGTVAVAARAVYVHETPGIGYLAALPAQPVPASQRLLWRVLLWLLRVPGAFPLVSRLRFGRR
jgi:hypothetical protein